MTNVISFAPRSQSHAGSARLDALTQCFASGRRTLEDVFWLKENAELLNILQATQTDVPAPALQPYEAFYESAMERLIFFPQYYRFLIGIVLDLEDLGLCGSVGDALCAHAFEHNLAASELSDLQRGEAARLLARRGFDDTDAPALEARLRTFAAHVPNFAVPNRKAAYELTHILFYLTDYGRKPFDLDPRIQQSLEFTGTLALLEQNYDLLAEVCIALRYAGARPPDAWEALLNSVQQSFQCRPDIDGYGDDYHCYLMLNWRSKTAGQSAFEDSVSGAGMGFYQMAEPVGALRELSYVLYNLNDSRARDWSVMKSVIYAKTGSLIAEHLRLAERITPFFERFFADFARAKPSHSALRGVPQRGS